MKQFDRVADGVMLRTAAQQSQGALVENVFVTLVSIAKSDPLRSGMRIRFGWSMFTLEKDGDALVICEPDFDADPLASTRPAIATSLDVIAKQAAFARAHGVIPVDVTFDQIIIARRGTLQKPQIQAFRDPPDPPDDSGWSVSLAGTFEASNDPEDYESIPTHRLLSLRPALLPALVLPPQYGICLDGDAITLIHPPHYSNLR